MRAVRGVEVGNIFQLGTRYTDALGCSFVDEMGQSHSVVMGSYGIGLGRLLACIAEEHHDEHGLVWPATVAPFPIHMILMGSKSGLPEATAARLDCVLREAGLEALFDDRAESPGVKFADADLIGLPLRLTVSERSLKNGGIELKRRDTGAVSIVPEENLIARIHAELGLHP
jgi:prolyl-tRNA synthetase